MTRRVLVICVFVVVIAAAVSTGLYGLRALRVARMFAGPAELQVDTREGTYPGLAYNLEAYSTSDNAVHAGSAPRASAPAAPGDLLAASEKTTGWEAETEAMHTAWKLDTVTAATRVARLRNPTVYAEKWVPRVLTVAYPTPGAVFPPNLCAPFIDWNDVHNNLWQVRITVPGGGFDRTWTTSKRRWRIPDDVWEEIKHLAVERDATVEVRGVLVSGPFSIGRKDVHLSQSVSFRVSADPADNAVVYRLVDPPFVNKKTPCMFARDIREARPRLFLNPRRQYCFNCHTFSTKRGDTGKLGIQVRYGGREVRDLRVYFALYDIDKQQGRKVVLPFEVQMTTFMAWSPDGARLATSANQEIAAFSPVVFETQSVGQPKSDLAVYDTATETVCLLPGASEPDILELYPRWTPDGKRIVFSRAEAGKHPTVTRFDLYVVPYAEGRGGVAEPIPGASANERSNFFPRFSPDGKWLSFVQADHGSLIKASSDIWIMPANLKGPARKLACNAPNAADSWHSWSSNSRWIVFASKRDDGVFARLYMTHIDEQGKSSPAVRLPIEDPIQRMSFNIPEFLEELPTIPEESLYEGVSETAPVLNVKPCEARTSEPTGE